MNEPSSDDPTAETDAVQAFKRNIRRLIPKPEPWQLRIIEAEHKRLAIERHHATHGETNGATANG